MQIIVLFLQMCVCTKKGMWPIATEIGSASGLRGYYRGYKSAIANAMISSALGFAVYQRILSQYKTVSGSRQASPAVKGVCAGELLFCSSQSLHRQAIIILRQADNNRQHTFYPLSPDLCCPCTVYNSLSDYPQNHRFPPSDCHSGRRDEAFG